MANYDDYRLEEAEDAAMQNSQTAKRVAIGGAAVVAGGAAVFAGTQLAGGEGEDVTPGDIANAFDAGQITDEVIVDDQPQEVHVYHHNVTPPPAPEPEPEVEFTESHIVYDENGNVIGSVDEGTIDGKDFFLLDEDGDRRADWMGYDANGNRIIEEDEIIRLGDDVDIRTGNAEEVHHHHNNIEFIEPDDPGFMGGEPGWEEDIRNDYDGRETEEFRGDLADGNPDYNNHASVDQYGNSGDFVDFEMDDSVEDFDMASADYTSDDSEDFSSSYDDMAAADYTTDEADDYSASYEDMAAADDYAADDIVPDDFGSDIC